MNANMRAMFDASAEASSGYSLNDQLLVAPTAHSSPIDVLLRFRLHHVVLTTEISWMYRSVHLPAQERDCHRFVWRKELSDLPLYDLRHVWCILILALCVCQKKTPYSTVMSTPSLLRLFITLVMELILWSKLWNAKCSCSNSSQRLAFSYASGD